MCFRLVPAGRTLCQLHLPAGALHADVNADGVIEHVQVSSGGSQPTLHHVGSRRHHTLGHCQVRDGCMLGSLAAARLHAAARLATAGCAPAACSRRLRCQRRGGVQRAPTPAPVPPTTPTKPATASPPPAPPPHRPARALAWLAGGGQCGHPAARAAVGRQRLPQPPQRHALGGPPGPGPGGRGGRAGPGGARLRARPGAWGLLGRLSRQGS